MKTRNISIALILTVVLSAGSANAAMISLGSAVGKPGDSVTLTVDVSADTDLAGVNIRISYDTNIFTSPSILRNGDILEATHVLDFHSPETGRLDVVAYAPAGTPVFKARTGQAFSIVLQIQPTASTGVYPLSFSQAGPVFLASSGLSDAGGVSLVHQQNAGTITVVPNIPADINGDGICTEADLFIMVRDWHEISGQGFLDADINQDQAVNRNDLLLFQNSWRESWLPGKP